MRFILLLLSSLLVFGHIQAQDEADFLPEIGADDSDVLLTKEEKLARFDIERENEIGRKMVEENLQLQNELESPVVEIDPCEKMHCGAGRVCELHGNFPKCVCISECHKGDDEHWEVCTNKNETWPSDCSVYQQRCLCNNNEPGCKHPDNVHLHIDYYGACRELAACTEEDMVDFPRRMRDWLFNIMRDLAERDALTEHFMQLELEAETHKARRWAIAAVWKWCDLDGDTDRSVSRHELFPIRAPLVSMEHCIAPFFESCDKDNDHRITLAEWGACLELEEKDLEERCDVVQRAVPHLG